MATTDWSYDFLRYDGSCHRSSPFRVDRATTRTTNRTMTYHQQKDRSQYATASGDRSKHCRSVASSPNHNQSYDQAIVRSGVTVALRVAGPLRGYAAL